MEELKSFPMEFIFEVSVSSPIFIRLLLFQFKNGANHGVAGALKDGGRDRHGDDDGARRAAGGARRGRGSARRGGPGREKVRLARRRGKTS